MFKYVVAITLDGPDPKQVLYLSLKQDRYSPTLVDALTPIEEQELRAEVFG